ncbi:hypothetical protein GP486_001106 [Trichoglossum hirsutum]|uniref:Uncharacterized protein n=1 Tax=Trichoglossum hirsutum TaxID=265104 RepID=A0A9P8LHM5_9PEZI|nr:hypothetical protein GP486_001106 [Trichoglossum hirsutum]
MNKTLEYDIPTAKPKASSTKTDGKSIRAPVTGRTDAISARDLITETISSPARMNAMDAPTGPPKAMVSPEVWKIPTPTAPEKAIPIALKAFT